MGQGKWGKGKWRGDMGETTEDSTWEIEKRTYMEDKTGSTWKRQKRTAHGRDRR